MKLSSYLPLVSLIAIACIAIQATAQDDAEDDKVLCHVRPRCRPNQIFVNCRCINRIQRCPPGTILIRRNGKIICKRFPIRDSGPITCQIYCQKPTVKVGCSCKKRCPPGKVKRHINGQLVCRPRFHDSDDSDDGDNDNDGGNDGDNDHEDEE